MTAPIEAVSARARRLWRRAIVVDGHNDLPDRLAAGYDPGVRHGAGFAPDEGHTDLPRLAESGIGAQFLAAWVDAPFARAPGASLARALHYLGLVRAFAERHPDQLRFATTAADVRAARAEGRIAILGAVEGGHAIEDSLEALRTLHEHGARYLTLTWNNGNGWAGSSIGSDGTRTAGLTTFGEEVIAEMNRLGMIVDLSHVSEATFADAVRVSSSPVVATHSCARALADHPRNLHDAQLRAVARTGGLVGVNFYARFLDADWCARYDAVEAPVGDERDRRLAAGGEEGEVTAWYRAELRARLTTLPPLPLARLVDHVDHVARVAGIEHVALGSDFDGVSALPEGMHDVTCLPRLVDPLLARGWSEDDVEKIVGGNWMRVMDEVLRG